MSKEINLIIAFKHKEADKTIYRKLITWWTKSKYYHVEIVIDNKWISSNPDTGVRIRELEPLRPGYDYKYVKTELTTDQYELLWKWIKDKDGLEYDMTGIIFSQVLPLRIHNKNKWFCSEIVTKILQLCLEPKSLDLIPQMVSPADLVDIYGIDVEGEIYEK